MHAFTIVSLLAAAAVTSAAPTPASQDPSVCVPGTGYYQVCSNAWGVTFKGCCLTDACSKGYCPSAPSAPGTNAEEPKPPVVSVPVSNPDPTVCAPGTGFFQSCSNGFRGCCKTDACGSSWCPDYKYGTLEPVSAAPKAARAEDPTICAPGTGFFQVCSNAWGVTFKGCCPTDACSKGYCPSTSSTSTPPPKTTVDDTTCAPGTGVFYVCANGFRGCCKGADPCTIGYCPA
jgi:hypothetical protein